MKLRKYANATAGRHKAVSPPGPLRCPVHGKGHREADPPAVADLLPDGRAQAGHGAGDPARRGGLQRDERGRVRRRFYADRSELESLRIQLTVDRPADGAAEQENYSLRPENFHLPAIAFTDKELAALQTALSLLDGEFAYAEPLRLALQQITWGRPSPLRAPEQQSVALGITASAGGHELSARLAKVETAIFRNKTITFDYYTMERDVTEARRVDPYHLLFQGGQFYLLGYSHERKAIRVFRLTRIRGKVSYATKAEHDFRRPADFDPRSYANRADWQLGEERGVAEVLVSERIVWQIERHFGRYGELREAEDQDKVFLTGYSSPRGLISWVFGLGAHASLHGPEELRREFSAPGEAAEGSPRKDAAGALQQKPRPCARARPASRRRAADRLGAGRGGSHRAQRDRDPPRALRAAGDAREHSDRGRASGGRADRRAGPREDRRGVRAAAALR